MNRRYFQKFAQLFPLLTLLGSGCAGPAPSPADRYDAGQPIDCGVSLYGSRFELTPIVLPTGSTRALRLTFRGRQAPVIALDLQVYASTDEGNTWHTYAQPLHFDFRTTDPLRARYVRCIETVEGEVVPITVEVHVPRDFSTLYAAAGVASTSDNAGLPIGARGQTGEALQCRVEPNLMRCSDDFACPEGVVTFHPTDEPLSSGTQICAQLIR